MSCTCHKLTFNARKLLRGDPTRTLGISRRWIAENRRRLRKLNTAIFRWLVTNDELALNVRSFEFQTDATKLAGFNAWLKQEIDGKFLFAPSTADPLRPWNATYIEAGYRRGTLNSFLSSKAAGVPTASGNSAAFMQSSFNQPETISKVALLYTRNFEQLKDVTSEISTQMSNILGRGLADRQSPRLIAKEMAKQITSIDKKRLMTIARTEVIRAHAEGQLDNFEVLGVKDLGINAEWSTAGDDRVCPDCQGFEGVVFTMEAARNMIPLHPNCRCTWVPSTEKATKGKTPKKAPTAPARTSTPVSGPPQSPFTPPTAPTPAPVPPPPAPAVRQLEKRAFRDVTKGVQPGDFAGQSSAGYDFASKVLDPDAVIKGVQRKALKAYQGNAFQAMNSILRKGRLNAEDVLPEWRKNILHMDDLMKKGKLPEDTYLFRGIGTKIDEPKPGDVLVDKGFVSTSTTPKVASGFTGSERLPLAIRAPEGTRAIPVNPVLKPQEAGKPSRYSAEAEIILPRGTKLLITDETITREYAIAGGEIIKRTFRVADIVPE